MFGCGSNICVAGPSGSWRRLVRNGAYPDWSPDGLRIAFLRPMGDSYVVFVVRADGTALTWLFPVTVSRYSHGVGRPTGGGFMIEDFYDDNDGDFEYIYRIGIVNADGTRFRWIFQQEAFLGLVSWSPDGQNIAFDCGEREVDRGDGDHHLDDRHLRGERCYRVHS